MFSLCCYGAWHQIFNNNAVVNRIAENIDNTTQLMKTPYKVKLLWYHL